MKRLCSFVLAICLGVSGYSQITIMEDIPAEEEVLSVYDSLTNFKHQAYKKSYNYHHLIGQTIMFCGVPEGRSGYTTFSKKLTAGEYFTIEGLLPDIRKSGLYDRLQLKNTKTGEISTIGGLHPEYNWQFVVVGHYEKLKQLYVGKEFIYVGPIGCYTYKEADQLRGISDGKKNPNIKRGTLWTCIDIQVKPRKKDDNMYLDDRSPIILVLENPEYGQYFCYYEGQDGHPIKMCFPNELPLICGLFNDKSLSEEQHKKQVAQEKERRTNMINKYGETIGNLIAERKIIIGMTKAMCRDSWGEPTDINTTILSTGTQEQWRYGLNSYVYFDGDKITAIQN